MEGAAGRTAAAVCVTGAGGFVASWLVERLLAAGRYTVHGTVRDPGDAKNAHLAALDGAAERLRLFRADLLDYGAVAAAVAGCDGVFHVASPVPYAVTADPEAPHLALPDALLSLPLNCPSPSPCSSDTYHLLQVELLAPAVTGTMNVLKACSEAKVKRVVVVSSVAAVMVNPAWPQSEAMDEASWSDAEFCRSTQNWYCLSKTLAEQEAFDYAKRAGLDVVSLCPSLVVGPLLQSTVNASSSVLVDCLKGGDREVKLKLRNFVDVRDVADALLLVYEAPEASGRYVCDAHARQVSDVVEMLKSWYPTYNHATKFVKVGGEPLFSSKKLKALGWKVRPFEESLRDSVESFRAAGVLD